MRTQGFTLIELMVVLLIVAIVLVAGVPVLQDLGAEQQLVAAADRFFHAVGVSRSQALRHGQRALMRPRDQRDWHSGWQISIGERVVLEQPPLPRGIAVAYTQGGETLGYAPNGQPLTRGSWYFSNGTQSRVVIINFLGRVRLCNPHQDTSCSKTASE